MAAFAAGKAEAACATGFSEFLDARGKARCVASDRARSIELRQHQRRRLKVLQDEQTRLDADQRELSRELGREQLSRTNAQRSEQNRRQINAGK
ncbi:MAG: hypothetical protein IT564_03805 [Rhodospirillales bacterium]|nr:hypothetical protein [Rhodospirillales bacterium]